MKNREKEILKRLDAEEIVALAYGFPLPSESFYENFNDLSSTGTTDDINGAWKPLESVDNFDGFDFIDDDFDDFLTKKMRKRRKVKKELRKQGLSRKEARKQAVKEIPRTTLKEVAKKVGGGLKKVGRGIVVGALAVPRASFLSLVGVNYRGFGWKLDNIVNKRNGTPASVEQKLKDKWYKLGGNYEKLKNQIKRGASRKKPFFCGKKCKRKLLDADAYKRFSNFSDDDYFNVVDPASAGVTTWVAVGSGVIGAITPIITLSIDSAQQKKAMENEQALAEQSLAQMSESEKNQIALAEQQIKLDADPKKLILANPELTNAEKQEALKQLADAEGKDTKTKFIRYALFGALGIGALFFISKIMSKNKK